MCHWSISPRAGSDRYTHPGLLAQLSPVFLALLLSKPCHAQSLNQIPIASSQHVTKVLPELPVGENNAELPLVVAPRLREIRFEGNQLFSQSELRKAVEKYVNRVITADDLQRIREQITRYYVDHGYINSQAIIPDQSLNTGVLTVRVLEGKLGDIRIFDFQNLRIRPEYISHRLKRPSDQALDINRLGRRLRLLHQKPIIESLQTELAPGLKPAESILNVRVREARRYRYGASVNNARSPSVGEYRVEGWWRDQDLTRRADQLSVTAGLTAGLKDVAIDYQLPVGANDAALRLAASHSESAIIEEPFDQIDISSTTSSASLAWDFPLIHYPDRSLINTFSLEKRRSKSLLDGEPFEFSPGASNGVARVSVLRWSLEGARKSGNAILAFNSRFSFGLGGLGGGTENIGSAPDGNFFDWFGQFQWVKRFGKFKSLLRLQAQRSRDNLLALEKYGLGGARSVRGYRENLFVRDEGWMASIETRYALMAGKLEPALFFDSGGARNLGASESSETLESAGLGLRWNPLASLQMQGYWAQPLKSVELGANRGLQDRGFHFSLEYEF